MDGFHCRGMIILSVYYTMFSFRSLKHDSHEIPVQLVRRHLLQQILETTFEEHLEAEVVLDDQGGLQTTVCYLNTHIRISAAEKLVSLVIQSVVSSSISVMEKVLYKVTRSFTDIHDIQTSLIRINTTTEVMATTFYSSLFFLFLC